MYVLCCLTLYIKTGGFTYSIQEAKKYRTKTAARKDWVYGWKIVRY